MDKPYFSKARFERSIKGIFLTTVTVAGFISMFATAIFTYFSILEGYMNLLPIGIFIVIVPIVLLCLYIRAQPPLSDNTVSIKVQGYCFNGNRMQLLIEIICSDYMFFKDIEVKIGKESLKVLNLELPTKKSRGFPTNLIVDISKYRGKGEREIQVWSLVDEEPWRSRKTIIDFNQKDGDYCNTTTC